MYKGLNGFKAIAEAARRVAADPSVDNLVALQDIIDKVDEARQETQERLQEKRMYEIWSEGYVATGGSGPAIMHSMVYAASFKEACERYAAQNPGFKKHFDPEQMTYWGCQLFDNEADARRSFG